MMATQQIALNRAEAMLKAAGVQYAIKLTDGTVLGTLELAPARRRAAYTQLNDFVAELDYVNTMKAIGPNEGHEWNMGTRERGVALQKVVSAQANRLWGTGNFITACRGDNKEIVEVLRIT